MGTVKGRLREAREALMNHAAARWAERSAQRDRGLRNIAERGPGAADSADQLARFVARESRKDAMGRARFQERIIGINDLTMLAPSSQAITVATPVARVTTAPGEGYQADGVASGLLLPQELLLTNYHVFNVRSDANGYAANFGHARDERGLHDGTYFELDPSRFFISNEALDFAIVAVKPRSITGTPLSDLPGTRLIEATGKTLTGKPVNIIQHPNGGPRQYAVSNNRLVDILPQGFLHYEADTLRGSSGSPVFNLDWELIALHHCGVPCMDGNRIKTTTGHWTPGDPEDDIIWIANEGTRVSFIVDHLKQAKLETAAEQAILDALLATTHDPLEAIDPVLLVKPFAESKAMPGNTFNFSGPVTVHAYAPSYPAAASITDTKVVAAGEQAAALMAAAPVLEEKKLVFDTNYARRPGYDPEFLGALVPLPTIDAARLAEVYTVGDYETYYNEYRDIPKVDITGLKKEDAFVLNYHHFSLIHNKAFRMCTLTASNCDYRPIARQDTRKRAAFGGEDWQYDPRVPYEYQLGNNDVYGPAKRVDRGHIVRREDNCWGTVGLATEFANSDTYHWTNCTPQHEAFNQENPRDNSGAGVYTEGGIKGVWGRFEGELAKQIEDGGGRAVIFAGPILDDFFKDVDWGNGKIRVPKRFWKVVVVPEARQRKTKLFAYGFVFSQEAVVREFGLTYERLALPEFVRQSKKLSEITALTGVEFPQVVVDAEQP
jgi:endonuclease G